MGGPKKDFHDVENFFPEDRTLLGALAPRIPFRYFTGPGNCAAHGGGPSRPEYSSKRLRSRLWASG